MNKSDVIELVNKLEMKEVDFFSRSWNSTHIIYDMFSESGIVVVDFIKNEWAQR